VHQPVHRYIQDQILLKLEIIITYIVNMLQIMQVEGEPDSLGQDRFVKFSSSTL